MRVEREIEGIAYPFAAGVAVSIYAGVSSPIAAFSLLSIIFLLLPASRRWPPCITGVIVTASVLSCGICAGITGNYLSVSQSVSSWPIHAAITHLGGEMGEAIDSIPFRSEDTNAVIKALLTGDRSSLSKETTETFRSSGASHLLALSGLHLGIIYGIINRILLLIGNNRKAICTRSVICILLCGVYTMATGAGASITRAFIFIAIGETARITGRPRSTASVLPAALLVQLAVNPEDIRSVGFQLSYLAMAGIAYIYPVLRRFWPESEVKAGRKGIMQRIWDAAALSISCQLTTGPLAWHYFGTFPQYFLLTNLICMPLTGILIPAAAASLSLSAIGLHPEILLRFTELTASALLRSLEVIASM